MQPSDGCWSHCSSGEGLSPPLQERRGGNQGNASVFQLPRLPHSQFTVSTDPKSVSSPLVISFHGRGCALPKRKIRNYDMIWFYFIFEVVCLYICVWPCPRKTRNSDKIFMFEVVYLCVCVMCSCVFVACVYVNVCMRALEVQKSESDVLELVLQMIVNHPTWALEFRVWASWPSRSALNHWAISPVPERSFRFFKSVWNTV